MKKDKKRILVVDDDFVTLRLLDKRLAAQSYEVIQAENGKKGVEVAIAEKPDLILLDVMMPDMTGAEVARVLQADESTNHIPIIFITVTISKRDDKVDKEIDIDGVGFPAFAKPLYFPKLLSSIKKALKKS